MTPTPENLAMKTPHTTKTANRDAVVADLARRLGFDTLETRRSDSLDFHDVAVWSIKEALEAAFEAGRRTRT